MSNDDVIAQLIATAQPRTREVRVCARGDLVDRHAALVAELAEEEAKADKSIAGNPEVERLAAEIVAVEEEQEASTVTFVMQSVSRRVWADLLAANPPRPQDKGVDFNPETFPPAVVQACAKTPALTTEDVDKLGEVLPPPEFTKLWMAALTLNVSETPHPKLEAASEIVRASSASSTTPDPAASPEASS